MRAVVFDLDGTLTDPLEGITRCIQHALERSGAARRSSAELAPFIGPPLRGTFALLLATEEPERVEAALGLYRQRFGEVGLFENTLYNGVHEMLGQLQQRGHTLFVATSKPRVYAERIVEHFGLTAYFAAVYGAELDGRLDDKGELLAHLLEQEQLQPGSAVMVGDRAQDILAAKRNGLRSIGVTYGYGSLEELESAGADYFCASPAEIGEYLAYDKLRSANERE